LKLGLKWWHFAALTTPILERKPSLVERLQQEKHGPKMKTMLTGLRQLGKKSLYLWSVQQFACWSEQPAVE
jgi:hypothetical protein